MSIPLRYSQWQVTLPFALNADYYALGAKSPDFALPQTEAVPVLSEFSPLGSDPSGWRHLTFHPSFVKILASGTGGASLNFQSFDLQSTNISSGSGVSKTKSFLFRIAKFTSPGITRVHKMRIWASDLSDFLIPQAVRILFRTSGPWMSGFAFVPEDVVNQNYWLPNSLPEFQNLRRTDGGFTIHGSGDADVSEWVYMALFASGTLPLGEYGDTFDGPSGFNVRVTYNVDNIFSLQD